MLVLCDSCYIFCSDDYLESAEKNANPHSPSTNKSGNEHTKPYDKPEDEIDLSTMGNISINCESSST